jgi:hypothetical protein
LALQPFVQAADDAAVAYTDKDAIRGIPAKLLANLVAGCLFALSHIGIVGSVSIVPSVLFGSKQAQLKGVVVGALDQHYGGAKNEQLSNFGLGGALWYKDDVGLANAGAQPGKGGSRVASTGGGDDLGPLLPGLRNGDGAGPVLEGGGRLAAVVFNPQMLEAQIGRQPVGPVERRPTDGQRRNGRIRSHWQQRFVTPDTVVGVV